MPEQIFKIWKKRIKLEWKYAFVTTAFVGLLAHMYKFANHLPNWDSLMDAYYPTHNMIQQGRQFQFLPAMFRGFTDLPWVIGLLSLVYLGLAMVLLTEIFEMHNQLPIMLSAALIVTSPTVISHWGYMFTADCYLFAYLLTVLAVWITLRCGWGWIIGGICLGIGLGIYQAYMPMAAALILLWLVKELLGNKKYTLRELLSKKILKFIVMGVTALLFYYVSLNIMLHMQGIELIDHQGMGSMHFPSLTEFVNAWIKSYIDTAYYFLGAISKPGVYGVTNGFLLLFAIILGIKLICRNNIYKQKYKMVLLVLCLLCYPCACHLLYFVTSDIEYHSLMQFGLVLFYVLIFWMYEQLSDTGVWEHWVVCGLAGVLIWTLIIVANIGYRAETLSYEKTYAMVGRIVNRMEELPDYRSAEELVIIGTVENHGENIMGTSPALTGYTDGIFVTHEKHLAKMMEQYFGINLQWIEEQQYLDTYGKEEIDKLGCWPDKDSVAQTGDTIIIKLSELEE